MNRIVAGSPCVLIVLVLVGCGDPNRCRVGQELTPGQSCDVQMEEMVVTFEIRDDGCVGNATLAALETGPAGGEDVWAEFGGMSTDTLTVTTQSANRNFSISFNDIDSGSTRIKAGSVELSADVVTLVEVTDDGTRTTTLNNPCFGGSMDIGGLFKGSRVSEASDIWRIDAVP